MEDVTVILFLKSINHLVSTGGNSGLFIFNLLPMFGEDEDHRGEKFFTIFER
jgi:hypothetical protein